MYFIEKGEDIVGKTIAFIHCAQFADAITLATTDGGVMVMTRDDDGEVGIYKSYAIQRYIFEIDSQKWMVEELKKLGIVDENEYAELCEARRLAREEADKKRKEGTAKHERELYLRLQKKYDPHLLAKSADDAVSLLRSLGFTRIE